MRDQSIPTFPALSENTHCDVCVVGAGIAGLTTAYLLAKEGKRVLVLEDGMIGSGETGRTTAHLSNALDDRYYKLEKLFGQENARLAAESHAAAIATIERICREENIDCDFERVNGYLFLSPDSDPSELDDELEAAHRAGLSDVRLLPDAGVEGFTPGRCLVFPGQGQFHALKYLAGLAEAVTRLGGQIYCDTHVSEVEGGDGAVVTVSHGPVVDCQAIVVATNTPVIDRVVMHTKQAPYRTYVVGARAPKGSITRALYWDTTDPYHYVRLQAAPGEEDRYDILIVGGEDHKTGHQDDPQERLRALEEWTLRNFPSVEGFEYRWSGQVMEPVDYLGFMGRNPMDEDNVYIITGDSGNGMTHATIGGLLITDLIQGRQNPWTELYDPNRVSLKPEPVAEFVKENAMVVADYADLVTPGDVDSAAEIAPGSGAVLRRGLKKVAVYKDPQGITSECSAICPHLGCVVNWNPFESSWDCPCHGSRFTPLGKVVNGPANTDLAPAEE